MRIAVALLLTALLAAPAAAELIAWDSLTLDLVTFPQPLHDYDSGTNIGPWGVQNGNLKYTVGNGLTYPHLSTAGYAAVGGGDYVSVGRSFSLGAAAWAPYLKAGSVGAEGTTLWASLLVNQWTEHNNFRVGLHNGGVAWGSDANMVSVGLDAGTWQLRQAGGASASTGVARIPGQTYLMVMKLEFLDAAADRVTLYVNPTPGLAAPDVAGASLTTKSDWSFRSLHFYPGNDALHGALDELRFGENYADVTPYSDDAGGGGDPLRVFFVGNSVTDSIGYEGLRKMAVSNGQTLVYGRQMIPGAPLPMLWDNPTSGFTTDPYGHYPNALGNYVWDAVSLQPFDRQLSADLPAAQNFIDLTWQNSPDAKILIYSRWPRKDGDGSLDYQAKWDRPHDGSFGSEETRAYFEALVTALRAAYPDRADQLLIAPVGDVFYRLDQKMEAGEVPGFSDIIEMYADGIHMNNFGSFVAGTTYYATLYGTDPTGLPTDSYGTIDPAFAAIVQQTVWEVVNGHPFSGVSSLLDGDVNGNGTVDDADLNILLSHWGGAGGRDVGDLNGNGVVDDADLNILLSHWGDGFAAIPEPASLALLALAAVTLRRR